MGYHERTNRRGDRARSPSTCAREDTPFRHLSWSTLPPRARPTCTSTPSSRSISRDECLGVRAGDRAGRRRGGATSTASTSTSGRVAFTPAATSSRRSGRGSASGSSRSPAAAPIDPRAAARAVDRRRQRLRAGTRRPSHLRPQRAHRGRALERGVRRRGRGGPPAGPERARPAQVEEVRGAPGRARALPRARRAAMHGDAARSGGSLSLPSA